MIGVTNMQYYDFIKPCLWLLIRKAPKDSSKAKFALTHLKIPQISDIA